MCYKEEKTTFFLRIPFIWAIFYRLMKMVGKVGRKRKEKVWFRNNIFLFQVSETFGNLEINFSIKLNALNDQLSVQCSIKRSFSKSAQSLGKHFLSAQVRALFKQKGKSILVINLSKYFETNVLILVKNLLGVFFFFFFNSILSDPNKRLSKSFFITINAQGAYISVWVSFHEHLRFTGQQRKRRVSV